MVGTRGYLNNRQGNYRSYIAISFRYTYTWCLPIDYQVAISFIVFTLSVLVVPPFRVQWLHFSNR